MTRQRTRRGGQVPPPRPPQKDKRTNTKQPHNRPGMPTWRMRGNVIFIDGKPAPRIFNPWLLTITFVLIFIGGLSGAVAAAQISNTEVLISQARSQRTYYQALNTTLREQVSERYTNDEIERMASERLGMARPDPSQVFEIYVPRHSYVVIHTDETVMLRENYFWHEIVTFLSGIANRMFGG